MSETKPLKIVCIQACGKYSEDYPNRLYGMLSRNLSVPFTLTCYCDHDKPLRAEIIQKDCRNWGLEGFFVKIKLFDRAEFPDEFLFLDMPIAILRDLQPMLDTANRLPTALIGMRDWNYDCFGSMAMYFKPNDMTQGFFDAYMAGTRYPTQTAIIGDQDYIDEYIKDHKIDSQIGYFENDYFASYKALRKLHWTDRRAEEQMMDKALMVKFHGPPKNEQLLDSWRNFKFIFKRKPHMALLWYRYFYNELKAIWRD